MLLQWDIPARQLVIIIMCTAIIFMCTAIIIMCAAIASCLFSSDLFRFLPTARDRGEGWCVTRSALEQSGGCEGNFWPWWHGQPHCWDQVWTAHPHQGKKEIILLFCCWMNVVDEWKVAMTSCRDRHTYVACAKWLELYGRKICFTFARGALSATFTPCM